ncbi:MAG: aminopeptidase [Alistipes sp.]|nr:aminopeptidase [Alistipes sp.]
MKRFSIFAALIIILMSACSEQSTRYEAGVSRNLATWRKATIEGLKYNIDINLVENVGSVDIAFELKQSEEIVVDFRATENILDVKLNGGAVKHTVFNEHIVIADSEVRTGDNIINIAFKVDNQSLNRNNEFLYTLLVPDRARTLFPCFDQPDIKASYTLALTIPEEWEAVSNTTISSEKVDPATATKRVSFAPTEPLSTYLFSFVAGKLYKSTYDDGTHTFTAYYRETEPKRLAQLETIFAEVKSSLKWLEEYTGIPYPFAKYDIIILPGFQYGGMEHTGATLYNDRQMFLSDNPTLDERLRRTQLIAHETAHMWFGDYVTMCWFDDVWTKEVFANYFAARMAEPLYADINHRLNRLKTYTTSALREDRTLGSNSIRQELDNMHNAGLIYGQIIYNKAPIVMDKLVELMGEEQFQCGIREYLRTYAYGNATWPELIAILDRYTDEDLATFSDVWVHQKGMPHIAVEVSDKEIIFSQSDPYDRGTLWTQSFNTLVVYANGSHEIVDITMRNSEHRVAINGEIVAILPNSCGRGYGLFIPDSQSREWIMANIDTLDDALLRESLIITLHECYQHDIITAKEWLNFILNHIAIEPNYLIASTLNDYLVGAMIEVGDTESENRLWDIICDNNTPSLCRRLTMTLAHAMTSNHSIKRLYTLWESQSNQQLDEQDYTTLAYELALRLPEQRDYILDKQRSRITNPDRIAQFDYISRATTADIAERSALFAWLLSDAKNRRPEPWAATMLSYLCHHTRQTESIDYIYKGLDALKEIQRTGDIFFPSNWLKALLSGHHSQEAVDEVERFLNDNPDYPALLKNKILQNIPR